MDRQSRKRLEEALKELGSPDRSPFAGAGEAGDFGAYLEIASSLQADARTLSAPPGGDRGRELLLSSLASQEATIGGLQKMMHSQPLIMKMAGAAAGVVLVFTGMAGASAAIGGPNVADPVLDVAGISDSDDDALENTDDATDATDDVDEMDDVDEEADDVSDEDPDSADDISDEDANDDVDGESDNSGDEDAVESTDDSGGATGDDSDDADDSSHEDETTDDHTADNVTGEEEEHN